MPKGTIYTAEKRAKSKAKAADNAFKRNEARLDSNNPLDYYPAVFKRNGLIKKRNETRDAAEKAPTGVKSAQITSKGKISDSPNGRWKEITSSPKNGPIEDRAFTTKFLEHSIVDNNKKKK